MSNLILIYLIWNKTLIFKTQIIIDKISYIQIYAGGRFDVFQIFLKYLLFFQNFYPNPKNSFSYW